MAVSDHNLAFHRALTERCPNGYLRRQLATIQDRLNTLRSSIFVFVPTRGRVSIDEHETLVAMIERGASRGDRALRARPQAAHGEAVAAPTRGGRRVSRVRSCSSASARARRSTSCAPRTPSCW